MNKSTRIFFKKEWLSFNPNEFRLILKQRDFFSIQNSIIYNLMHLNVRIINKNTLRFNYANTDIYYFITYSNLKNGLRFLKQIHNRKYLENAYIQKSNNLVSKIEQQHSHYRPIT